MANYQTYKGIDNVSLQNPTTKVLSDSDYAAKALKQYNPSYNLKTQGLQNTLMNNLSNLENSKGTIAANYDKSVANQNLNNQVAKNNINNDSLNRGLSRSSIVTSGLASADLANNRALAGIQGDKATALNNVALQQANASADNQNQLNTMAANRLDETQTLADKLKDTDINRYNSELGANRNFYMQQLGYNQNVDQLNNGNYWKDVEQNNWQKSFDNSNYWKGVDQSNTDRNYNLQKTNSDREYELNKSKATKVSSEEQGDIDNAALANFNAMQTPQDQYEMLSNPNFVKQVSPSTYKQLYAQYQKNLQAFVNTSQNDAAKKEAELKKSDPNASYKSNITGQSFISASMPAYDYGSLESNIYSGGR